MYFQDIINKFRWLKYDEQIDKSVTYIFVSQKRICRLKGYSDILYIGKTKQSIKKRYKQEIVSINTNGNSQSTNLRITHILSEYGLNNCCCYFTKTLSTRLTQNERTNFLSKLKIWDKRFYLNNYNNIVNRNVIPLEKYLLILYSHEHLELPPMNNRF